MAFSTAFSTDLHREFSNGDYKWILLKIGDRNSVKIYTGKVRYV